ncbi:MAG TPA: outer membrane lipoprotein-sorting protein [Gammaproteobacteria bacterium]|nr:outer membrane lipoprotein-sorting protein [Gammaproteobacteria bacterium]
MKNFVVFSILVLLSLSPAAVQTEPAAEKGFTEGVDAKEVIRKMDLLLRGDSSFGSYRMTITDPDWQRTLTLNAGENRIDDKTFIEILSPAKEAGIVTLKIGLEMWNYLPRVERIIKIPPSMMFQPWMGSDFTNDDLVKASSVVTDYSHEIVAEEIVSGFQAYKVELIPKPDAPVVWGRLLVWVRQSDSMPLRQEFFADDGELIRVLQFDNIVEVRGREVPTYWEMKPVGEKGRQTTMEVLDLEIDVEIDDRVFSLRNLKLKN